MSGRYKAYGEYKDSGVEWLGEIPEEWFLTRMKFAAKINMGQSPSSDDCNSASVGTPFLQGNAEFGKLNPYAKQYCPFPKKLANIGDLLFSVRAPVGALNMADKIYGIGRGLCSISNSKYLHKNFLWWVLPSYKYQFDAIATGSTFEAVSAEQVENLYFSLPKIQHQNQIAAFLDHETAKIDTLIDKQQQLIELLKEKRQAVISHTVTKGLDPDVPMKDSGVDWLGEVPEHWNVTSTKYVAILNPNKSELKIKNKLGLCSFVSMEKIKLDSLVLDEDKTVVEVFNSYTYFRNDDVLMAKVTPCFENKNMVIANNLTNGIGFGTSEIYVFRCRSNLNKEYFLYRIQENNFMEMATAAMTGAGGLKRVPAEMLNSYLFAMPQYQEQAKIADFLDIKISKINEMIELQQQQIELLKERRTALISAAVTGKIDVRDWQVPVTQTESDEVMA